MALTDKQRRFVDEYLIDFNASAAYKRAGYAAKGNAAEVNAARLLRNAQVQAYLSERQKALQERTEITQDMVLKRYWDIATADPNELVQYRRLCCRYCWGIGHSYQWSEAEFLKAQVEADGENVPDASGGFGFDPNRAPHPECSECGGLGKGKVHVSDTRELAGGAKLLYAGVRVGKDGLEVKMHDQLRALDAVARHIGFDKSKIEVSGPNGGPVEVKSSTADALRNLTDEQLAQLEAIAAAASGSGGNQG